MLALMFSDQEFNLFWALQGMETLPLPAIVLSIFIGFQLLNDIHVLILA